MVSLFARQRISDSLGVGDHAGADAVRVSLTIGSPVTTGVSTGLKAPFATGPEVGSVMLVGAKSLRDATTLTATLRPSTSDPGVYVAAVAPAMALPSASHWKRTLASGFQVPGVAVSGTPTCGVPVTVGGVRLSICLSTKWMKPLGQPGPLLSLRQWKSPPQLSSEMTISVGEITRST
jgi:hypothetical protein